MCFKVTLKQHFVFQNLVTGCVPSFCLSYFIFNDRKTQNAIYFTQFLSYIQKYSVCLLSRDSLCRQLSSFFLHYDLYSNTLNTICIKNRFVYFSLHRPQFLTYQEVIFIFIAIVSPKPS